MAAATPDRIFINAMFTQLRQDRAMRVRRFLILPAFVLALLAQGQPAALADQLIVSIDLSDQVMVVSRGGRPLYDWPVSTARRGYRTPMGTFHPYRLERVWYSTKYDYAPMPYSVFFLGGYAIHGTTDIAHLGRPVSHGCIRLHPDNARKLFSLIRSIGMKATAIVINR
jgi:lipoprotein-anchoring transpeptidase ErfK/SrfK